MIARLIEFALVQRVLVCILGLILFFGGLYAFHILDVVAYPDPSPPMIEVITQYPGWSAEEIERQITIPIETALLGMPGLKDIRSLSIFGLSDIKFYFDFGTNYFVDRQEVLNRLAILTSLPTEVQPALSPWWAIAEIYRYELVSNDEGFALTDLKALQDWKLQREFKRTPGVIDVTAFGGTTKEYHVDINPGALISYGVFSLVATGTAFSISAAVGVISTLGVAILGGVLLISRVEDYRKMGLPLEEAIFKGAGVQLRPILMATLAAAIGLLPAAAATGIGSQAQRPLARVVVGGMLTSAVLILLVLPVLSQLVHRRWPKTLGDRSAAQSDQETA